MPMIGRYWEQSRLVKFSVKERGISHIENEKNGKPHPWRWPCQDAGWAYLTPSKTIGIACVADGHGGNKYFRSDKGSVLAVQVAEKALFDFCGTTARAKLAFFHNITGNEAIKANNIQPKLKQLESNIIYNWRNDVQQHLKDNPFTEAEVEFCKENKIVIDDDPSNMMFIYGTTLLASLVSDSFWFVIQIGDGKCVVLENKENIYNPITEDERLAFGKTTSLCDNDALSKFREAYGFSQIIGLTVATDGISDSFEPEKYLQFNKELYDKFTSFPDTAEAELKAFLPDISERGSRDDVSIAGLFRIEK
jgi:serine/threonine protein phosphatase PrpC